MLLSFFTLVLTGCAPEPTPPPTPAETVAEVAVQAATSRGYVIHICAKPTVRDAKRVDVTWKGLNVVQGQGGWSEPQKLMLTMPTDDMLCGNPSAIFNAGSGTTLKVQLDDMSSANGIWIAYPSPEYRNDEADPNQLLSIPITDDDGWFTFAVYPAQRGVPLVTMGTVRPGRALAPAIETPEASPAQPPAFHPIEQPIVPLDNPLDAPGSTQPG